jgi:peroxiredoxin
MKAHRTSTESSRAIFRLAAMLVALWLLAAPWARAGELPRYKFTVGQELTYKTAETPEQAEKKPGRRPPAKVEYTLVVVGRNDDGSWRLLFRNSVNYGGHERSNEGYFDMTADGRVVNLGTLSVMANPTILLPPLPPDAASVAGSWSGALPLDETRSDCSAVSAPTPGDTEWSFAEEHHNVFEPIYLVSTHRDYVFDLEKGVVRKVTVEARQGWPARANGETNKSALELTGTRQWESGELVDLKRDMDKYFAACAEYDRIMAAKDFTRIDQALDKGEKVLKELKGKFKAPRVQAMLDHKLEELPSLHKYERETAERFAKLIGKPSEDWKTTDLDDKPRSLEDYRGKVVLLDFWYRGCGWCIRAMPQFKQLVDEFKNDRVAVLGMNNDTDLDDARLVIDKMGLNYETLKNGGHKDGIHTKYGVQGWPTLVVLDGTGVVRHVHVGYSPHLRQEPGDKIRELLAENTATSAQAK